MSWEKEYNDILSEVCECVVDCPHSTAKDEGEGYPLIRTPNVGKGRLILEGVHKVSEMTYKKRNARATPQKDDIIFAREAPAGNVAIIVEGQKVCLGQRTVLIRPDKSKVDPSFLVYYLLAPEQQYKLLGTANGATVAHVNMPVIRNLEISLPPLETQHRIATVLSAYDDLIENNQKQIALLEEATQRLYKEWFIDLHFPGYENVKVIDGVPEGWCRGSIDFKIKILSGYAFKSSSFNEEGKYKIVTIKNVKDAFFDGDKVDKIMDIPSKMPLHCKLNNGDILLSLTGNVGRVCIVSGDNYLLNQRVAKLESDCRAFTYCLFRSEDMTVRLNNLANGAAQQNLSPIRVGKEMIAFPSNDLILSFERYVEPMINKMNCVSNNIYKLEIARDSILPKLMSGEIEV